MTMLTNERRAELRAKVGPEICEAIHDLVSASIDVGRCRRFNAGYVVTGMVAEDRLLALIAELTA